MLCVINVIDRMARKVSMTAMMKMTTMTMTLTAHLAMELAASLKRHKTV